MNNREKVVIKTSIISILANIVLAFFKAFIGLLANSIAIISDAVNNLSDALSSIITIIGTKLAEESLIKTSLWIWKNRVYDIFSSICNSFICRCYCVS